MISNLIYVSVRKLICTDEEIDKILASCKRNNHGLDITGVLLYSDKLFIQYLEGNKKKINDLYQKIKLDNRHSNALIIASSEIQERIFPSWQMGSKSFKEDTIHLRSTLDLNQINEFNNILNGETSKAERVVSIIKRFFD